MNKMKVLFLCVGNSVRSQMAEAIVNARLGARWRAYSAGSCPTGYVHPMAIKVLSEIGIQHQGRSKSIDELLGQSFDVVITLCDDSAEDCPVWLGKGKKLHCPFPDPAAVKGSEEKVTQSFRQVRDAIIAEIIPLLSIQAIF